MSQPEGPDPKKGEGIHQVTQYGIHGLDEALDDPQ
jgi:hypothetical protein